MQILLKVRVGGFKLVKMREYVRTICLKIKYKKSPLKKASKPLELIHSDVCGSFKPLTKKVLFLKLS